MTSILRPKAVRPGDLVAIVPTSGGLEKDEAPLYERGVEVLEEMGFVVRPSPLVDLDRQWWWAAALPAEVAEELNRHLRDPEVRAIFSLTGGRMTLSYLDRSTSTRSGRPEARARDERHLGVAPGDPRSDGLGLAALGPRHVRVRRGAERCPP